MIYICKPKKLAIYVNKSENTAKTPSEIKAETGCDEVINLGLFSRSTFQPVAQLRVNGVTLANENWGTNYGYAFENTGSPFLTADINAAANFAACVCIVKDSQPVTKLNCPPDMTYATARTAVGTFFDGRLWMYCTKDALKPEQLRDIAVAAGVRDAVMYDGGGSTQCDMPTGKITSTRKVSNFLCVWEDRTSQGNVTKEGNKMKVYLSPSSQQENKYANGTNEQEQCRRIASYCKNALTRCGFDVLVGAAEIDYTGRVYESNKWGADIHVPIHTNASKRPGDGHGVIVFVYSLASERLKLAQPVFDAIDRIATYKSWYGVQADPNLYEIKHTNAKCVYVEAAFHDTLPEAAWIVGHADEIGEAICEGICNGTGVRYIDPNASAKAKTTEERIAALEAWAKTKGFKEV